MNLQHGDVLIYTDLHSDENCSEVYDDNNKHKFFQNLIENPTNGFNNLLYHLRPEKTIDGTEIKEGDFFLLENTGLYYQCSSVDGTFHYLRELLSNEDGIIVAKPNPGWTTVTLLKEIKQDQIISNDIICCNEKVSWINCAMKCNKCWKVYG